MTPPFLLFGCGGCGGCCLGGLGGVMPIIARSFSHRLPEICLILEVLAWHFLTINRRQLDGTLCFGCTFDNIYHIGEHVRRRTCKVPFYLLAAEQTFDGYFNSIFCNSINEFDTVPSLILEVFRIVFFFHTIGVENFQPFGLKACHFLTSLGNFAVCVGEAKIFDNPSHLVRINVCVHSVKNFVLLVYCQEWWGD